MSFLNAFAAFAFAGFWLRQGIHAGLLNAGHIGDSCEMSRLHQNHHSVCLATCLCSSKVVHACDAGYANNDPSKGLTCAAEPMRPCCGRVHSKHHARLVAFPAVPPLIWPLGSALLLGRLSMTCQWSGGFQPRRGTPAIVLPEPLSCSLLSFRSTAEPGGSCSNTALAFLGATGNLHPLPCDG